MPKERIRKGRLTIKRARVRMPKAKERKEKEIRKERKVVARAKVKAKTRKAKARQRVTLVESQDVLPETVRESIFDRLQVIQPIHLQEEHQ